MSRHQELAELANVIVQVNHNNGWDVTTPNCWENKRKLRSKNALIHSEVAEATESARHNDIENFARELADIKIRILDVNGGLGFEGSLASDLQEVELIGDYLEYAIDGWDCKESVVAALDGIHIHIGSASISILQNDPDNYVKGMAAALRLTERIARAYRIDLDATVQAVIEKNRHRGYKHGGKAV